jgi:hypothetical protein
MLGLITIKKKNGGVDVQMMKNNNWIIINFEFNLIHRQPEITDLDVAFMQNIHRHLCKCRVEIERPGSELDEDIISIKQFLEEGVKNIHGETTSLDGIADMIKINLDKLYLGSRKYKIRIMETDDIGYLYEYS